MAEEGQSGNRIDYKGQDVLTCCRSHRESGSPDILKEAGLSTGQNGDCFEGQGFKWESLTFNEFVVVRRTGDAPTDGRSR